MGTSQASASGVEMNAATNCSLSVDAMGGDHAPASVIDGCALAAIRHPSLRFILHGDEKLIAPLVAAKGALSGRCDIRHAPNRVAMDEKPSQALRRRHGTSMWEAVGSVKNGEAGACVSAGNTGALMAMAKFQLKTLPGIERPAIAALWPTVRGETVVLDVGANVGLNERHLIDFAILGEACANALLGLQRPSVGLLNIGAEEVKGTEAVKAAAADIRSSGIDMNFHGFVEGDDISLGTVDVVVTDGFTGNVALKTAEGTARLIAHYLSSALKRSLMSKLGAFLAMGAFKVLKEKMDPRSVNGGVFLGLGGAVVKSHGGTDGMGFASAIDLAVEMAGADLAAKIAARMAEIRRFVPETNLERLEHQKETAQAGATAP